MLEDQVLGDLECHLRDVVGLKALVLLGQVVLEVDGLAEGDEALAELLVLAGLFDHLVDV